ncbi:hypothetical protein M2139_001461 [Enterococcus sp. PF1-24]|uniref:GFA family protein n=1 Tax=unclassified Enterococcus TaxID=2608891 RepID=UPI00247351DD|nr:MULTISPECIES: GFA family protein [unclassified Enterococcus]MDH6364400.1 hypothetical protein [Enterococcus sp. PFB1-1]MDH6401577.1 hypothetical protein [Enterococcus sp. PF1-24]
MEKTGKCLCGAVSITVKDFHEDVHACHCSMCTQWSAGPFLSVAGGTSKEVMVLPEDAVTCYQSSEWAERGFCKNCGTTLFYHVFYDDVYYLSASLFEETAEQKLTEEIFYDKKPAYYTFANPTVKKTEAEIMAAVQAEFSEA